MTSYIVTRIYFVEAETEEQAKQITYISVPDKVIVEELVESNRTNH